MILGKLAEHPDGITSFDLSKVMDINLTGRLSKLFDVGAVERTALSPHGHGNPAYLYKSKATAPSITPAQTAEASERRAIKAVANV